tara:strand:- start:12767 stop:13981 length:1215 start_codon:yes stop_codon:yes gene_type:complete
MKKKIRLIGIGFDGFDGLSKKAQSYILDADIIIGGKRHIRGIPNKTAKYREWSKDISQDIDDLVKYASSKICILATGDPLFFGVGSIVMKRYKINEVEILPNSSSLSLCCAKIGYNVQDIEVVSLHGRDFSNLVKFIQPNNKIFILSNDDKTPEAVINYLKMRKFSESKIHIFENIGNPDEKITKTLVKNFKNRKFAKINSILVECIANKKSIYFPNYAGLEDKFFENDGQMTKSAIRSITISKLEPIEGSVLWDIGSGSGSVSIEWSKIHKNTKIFAIEKNEKRLSYIKNNIKNFGIQNIDILHGSAPELFSNLPLPNRIFIGGGLSAVNGEQIIEESILHLTNSGKLVANGVSLETEFLLIEKHKKFGGDLYKYSSSSLREIGGLHAWDQNMPVVQWVYSKE